MITGWSRQAVRGSRRRTQSQEEIAQDVEKKTLDLKVTLKDMVMHMLLSMGAGRIIRFLTYG